MRAIELQRGLSPQRGFTGSRGQGMPFVSCEQQEIAFNQSENKWK